VLRALRDKSHIVRLPQLLQADMQMIKKGRYRYAVENQGLMPSDSALAELLQWPLDRVEAALKGLASASATSLDAEPAGDHKGGDTQSGQSLHSRLPSEKHDSIAAENEVYRLQLRHTLRLAMSERDPRRIDILRLKYGLEDGVEWTYPQLAARFNTTANIAKGIVRTEMNFLRRAKKSVLQDFVGHLDYN
jgi:DNA-directed RNA polymerase sigma subunit (sigma70/sigma32)